MSRKNIYLTNIEELGYLYDYDKGFCKLTNMHYKLEHVKYSLNKINNAEMFDSDEAFVIRDDLTFKIKSFKKARFIDD